MSARRRALVLILVLLASGRLDAANRYDPRLTFRSITTPRFTIYFHQGEAPMARRLARVAEEVAGRLESTLGRARGRVYVILVNQTDVANGWATPTPYNLIELVATPPPGESTIGNTDDWLRLVFSHEYTHIVHLGASRGWIGGLQRAFGRNAALFPNLFLPQWQVEGIATFEESALTGQGRVPAGDFRAILEAASSSRRFDPIDRAGGGLVDWPGGNAAYLYGAYFHEYLARRFGDESLRRLSADTAGRLPFFGAPAFRRVFGRSLGDLWMDFEKDAAGRTPSEETRATRLSHHGFVVAAPRYSLDGRLFYATANPHGFPSLMVVGPEDARPRKVATRYFGGQTSISGRTVVFDQLDVARDVALQSDLYTVSTDGTRGRRLTRGARAADPDVSPDGVTIVCTVQRVDRRDLATLTLPPSGAASPVTLISEPATEFSSPRWSPDGRAIVATRRRLGGPSELVTVDASTHAVTVLTRSVRNRVISPEWRADGQAILFASDRGDHGFAIYDITLTTGAIRRLEDTGRDARSPTLSPDGRALVFVGSTADGLDLFSVPIASARWQPIEIASDGPFVAPAPARASARPEPVQPPIESTDGAPYRPWATLAPRFWSPLVDSDSGETRIGAITAGADALGRHAYGAAIGWSSSRARPDWRVTYAYDRWRPTLFLDISDDVDPWRSGETRSSSANAGALLPFRAVRRSSVLLAALHGSNDTFECRACQTPVSTEVTRRSFRTGWHFDASHAYGYSVGPEDGGTATVTAEFDRRALGATGDASATIVDLRRYRRLFFPHAVVAARLAGATSWGDASMRRRFTATGSAPPEPFAFGSDAIGLIRGFDDSAAAGFHAAVVNLDYRFPIVTMQRGIGTLPFFLRVVHGAVFADCGHAWSRTFKTADVRASYGAELSFDTVIGYILPITLTSGAAWRHDPVGNQDGLTAFGRIGYGF